VLPLFWMNTILWDAARFFASPGNDGDHKVHSSISRRIARQSHQSERNRLTWLPSLYFFVSSWIVFGGTLHVLPTAYHGQHPTEQLPRSMSAYPTHINVLNPWTRWLYCLPECSSSIKNCRQKKCGHKFGQNADRMKERLTVKSFFMLFKTYLFTVRKNTQSLDSRDDIEIYEENDIRDLLQLDSIYRDRTVVDCTGTVGSTIIIQAKSAGPKTRVHSVGWQRLEYLLDP
jgi:hypothetical protein